MRKCVKILNHVFVFTTGSLAETAPILEALATEIYAVRQTK